MLLIIAALSLMSSDPLTDGPLLAGYKNGKPTFFFGQRVPLKDKAGELVYLEYDTANSFNDMLAAAAIDGYFISINNAFRENKEQKLLFSLRKQTGLPVSEPGYSKHEQGMAIDISSCISSTGEKTALYWWLVRNSRRFGFINTVPTEPWHWEYSNSFFKKHLNP